LFVLKTLLKYILKNPTMNSKPATDKLQECTFEEFFLNVPPGSWRTIKTDWEPGKASPQGKVELVTTFPDLKLDCPSEKCGGPSWFSPKREYSDHQLRKEPYFSRNRFAEFVCRSCGESRKTYAVLFNFKNSDVLEAYKFGEFPHYGPPLPAKALRLFRQTLSSLRKLGMARNWDLG
jgi:hypothetical protein